jgi:hypothetical protein
MALEARGDSCHILLRKHKVEKPNKVVRSMVEVVTLSKMIQKGSRLGHWIGALTEAEARLTVNREKQNTCDGLKKGKKYRKGTH